MKGQLKLGKTDDLIGKIVTIKGCDNRKWKVLYLTPNDPIIKPELRGKYLCMGGGSGQSEYASKKDIEEASFLKLETN